MVNGITKNKDWKKLRKITSYILIIVLISNISLAANHLIIDASAATEEFEPDYGAPPKIDGNLNISGKEWNNATKTEIRLYQTTTTDPGLPINLWVMFAESALYICIQFELDPHQAREFVGILISESTDEEEDDFVDAKIIQFKDIGEDKAKFNDYYITNGNYVEDDDSNGDGDAKLDEELSIYEFSIPVNNTKADDNKEDVFLDYGEEYAFKIIYGENDIYPDEIKRSNTIIISIEYPPAPPPRNPWIDVHNILTIIIFIGLITVSSFYIYRVVVLNQKLERERE